MERQNSENICEIVRRAAPKELLELLHGELDWRKKGAMFDHILGCADCLAAHRKALSALDAGENDNASLLRCVLRPLIEWMEKPQVELEPVYGPEAVAAREWEITVGDEDGMTPSKVRLATVDRKDDVPCVFVESDCPNAAYRVRGISGAQVLFELELRPGKQYRAVPLEKSLDPDCEIEIYQVD